MKEKCAGVSQKFFQMPVGVQGFEFNSASVSAATNSTNLSLPSKFFVIISYQSASYTYLETNVGNTLKLSVYNGTAVSGFVSATNGAKISTVYVTIINGTNHNYTTTQFTGNSFVVYSPNWNNEYLIVSSPGYNSTQYQGKNLVGGKYLSNVILQPASSSIYYNYSVSQNLQTLNLNITYRIGNNTAMPQFANSSVGSLYWQWNIDSLNAASVSAATNSTNLSLPSKFFAIISYQAHRP